MKINYVKQYNSLLLRLVLEKDKFNGLKFLNWFRNLKPIPNEPTAKASRVEKEAYKKHLDDILDIGCLMLATITLKLQKQHEGMAPYDMIQHLKELHEGQACQERYETSKPLFRCKMLEGTPVGTHILKMMGYIEGLEKLGSH
ncbi:Retrovirus-related Pol polyprotein from transposon TNT 1-94 [Gossypium australe]|uniref:Retrovirus-related Pol polyprotein from transposon TNT 1-94 n=1 Tax=Gossypium australe TaxID=47621 RepID=A0A5B6WS09_9ROSI|nr:Retrovirus-related Pol polyprotein from transposon TNT 1-94 [Gossypium australe]